MKNKTYRFAAALAILLALALVFVMPVSADDPKLYSGGSGTQAEPYLISTADDLKNLSITVNSGSDYYEGEFFQLTADIDLENQEWTPIGSAYVDHGFMGSFDGNSHKIYNLNITVLTPDSDGYVYAGLFGVTEGTDENNQNVIKNLIIENVNIETEGHIVSAAIAYPYYTVVDNIKVCGNIHIKGGDYTSGVLAYTRRCVDASNLYVDGNPGSTITGSRTMGGVISDIQMNGGLIADYSNFGVSGVTITGETNVGGISGIISGQTLNGANVNNVVLSCSDKRVGVVSGSLGSTSTITDITVTNVDGASSIIGGAYDSGNPVEAKIGDTYYATLQAAITAANSGDTITLLSNIESDDTIIISKTITLDLNGNTIIVTDNWVLKVDGNSVLTLTDNSEAADGNIKGSKGISIVKGSKLIMNSGNIVVNGANGAGIQIYGSEATMNGGTITAEYGAILIYSDNDVKGIFTMNGGKLTSKSVAVFPNGNDQWDDCDVTITGGEIESNEADAVYWVATGKLTISGGTLTGKSNSVYVKSGSVEITGGTFISTGDKKNYEYKNSGHVATGDTLVIENVATGGYQAVSSVSISGGTFTSANAAAVASYDAEQLEGIEAVSAFITGGTFSSNPSASIASGYEVVQPGDKYLVQKYVDRSSSSSSSSKPVEEPEEPVEPEVPVEPETPIDEPVAGEPTVETEVTDGGEVPFETPAGDGGAAPADDDETKITGVVLPTGTDSEVTFVPVSEQPAPAGQEENTKKVFEINVPTYEKGKAAVVKFTMTVAELAADGKTAAEVALWHFDEETGEWTKLLTSYIIVDGIVYFEAITYDFSPFAIVYEEAPVDEPVEEPETPASPAPLFAVLAGLGAAVVLRRK